MKLVMVMSGGLDSTVAAKVLMNEGHTLIGLGFDYGQRHRKELEHLASIWDALGMSGQLIDLRGISELISASALMGASDIPHGHYAEEAMRTTVVPNRNMIMASIAWGYAETLKADGIGLGVHGGDRFIYPDCRPEFIGALGQALRLGNVGGTGKVVRAPLLHVDKAEIVRLGDVYGVPLAKTWTCYEGGDVHCGECGACYERREAFVKAKVIDPTVYAV